MKFSSLRKWDDAAKSPGLLLFAQLCEEMLFDFSLDTYKPSIMHSGLLCSEALSTIDEIEAGNIREANLRHVVEELLENITSDPVALSLLPLPLEAIAPTLKNPKSTMAQVRTVIELLSLSLQGFKYKARCEELIRQHLSSAQDLNAVRTLARTYMTTLLAMGYSERGLSEAFKSFFFYGKNRIAGPECVDDLFSLFSGEKYNYRAAFKVGKLFRSNSSVFGSLGVEIKTGSDGLEEFWKGDFLEGRPDQDFAVLGDIEARDVHGARVLAERRLKGCASLLSIFHHKETPTWSKDCVVLDDAGKARIIRVSRNSMQKGPDLAQAAAAKKLGVFLSDFSLERNSFAKFLRSVELHSMALSSDSVENQLLNLWIAIETLVPPETKNGDDATIQHVVRSLLPFLNIGYPERLLTRFSKDVVRWDPGLARAILRSVPGRRLADKFLRLLICAEYEDERQRFFARTRDFQLLKVRAEYFSHVLATPEDVRGVFERRARRVEWQLRRIYRTRNVIVHSGKTPPYTSSLVEHAHNYLDLVLDRLVKLASSPRVIASVAQGFKQTELAYETSLKRLQKPAPCFTSENCVEFVFGVQ